MLISAPYFLPVVDEFEPLFSQKGVEPVRARVRERLTEDELLSIVPGVDGAICGDDEFTARVLEASPRLKVISKWGTGIDSIDSLAAERLGVSVFNTPEAFTDPVADSVLAYILSFARGTPWMDQNVKAGKWSKRPGVALHECVLSVVGVGAIGRAVARRATAFGMSVLGHDTAAVPEAFVKETGLRLVDRDTALRAADYLSLNCDLNPSSFRWLGGRELSLMKPTAVVINTARGPIIDEEALVVALGRGEIAGAGLDVFENEPLPPDSPLLGMENVLLAPHNANSSPAAWARVHENTVHNLLSGLESYEQR